LYIARNDMNGSMMRGKSPPEQPTIIPYTDPKVGLQSCCCSQINNRLYDGMVENLKI
jgi:hypothetical protein